MMILASELVWPAILGDCSKGKGKGEAFERLSLPFSFFLRGRGRRCIGVVE